MVELDYFEPEFKVRTKALVFADNLDVFMDWPIDPSTESEEVIVIS